MAIADFRTLRDFLDDELALIKKEGAKASDVLVVYFAGHGVSVADSPESKEEHWFFLPSDANAAEPGSTNALGSSAILGALQNYDQDLADLPILIFLDTCRDFATSVGAVLPRPKRLDFGKVFAALNAVVFVSTGVGKSVQELPEGDLEHDLADAASTGPCASTAVSRDDGGGAFTYVLLQILNGRERDLPSWSNTDLEVVHVHLKLGVKKICKDQEPMIVPSNNVVEGFKLFQSIGQ